MVVLRGKSNVSALRLYVAWLDPDADLQKRVLPVPGGVLATDLGPLTGPTGVMIAASENRCVSVFPPLEDS